MEGLGTQGQDGAQFEDALRRLNALENKLAAQVLEDISELRKQWVQGRVDRVTHNTYKLYEVRKNLKTSKLLYVEEEHLLGEFGRVKAALVANCMDDDTFDAAKQTCFVLGGKLSDVRTRQLMCYSTSRELSPTPLDRHRSRDPSPFRMPPLKLSSGTATPRDSSQSQDPHAYFSRPESSQSIYGGRGGAGKPLDLDTFRAAMEAKQMDDDSPPQRRPNPLSKSTSGNIVLRSASGVVLCRSDGTEAGTSGAVFGSDRPGSAMSDCSINIPDLASHHQSHPSSRQEVLGDVVSGTFDHFSEAPVDYCDKDVQEEIQRKMVLQEDKDRFYREKREAAEAKERADATAELQNMEKLKIEKDKKLLDERQASEAKKKKESEERQIKKEKAKREEEEAKKLEEKRKQEQKKEEEAKKLQAEKKEAERERLEEHKKEEEKLKLETQRKEEEQRKNEEKKKVDEQK